MAVHFADLFEHAVDAFPDRMAIICGPARRTYAELEERANRFAHYLASAGVGAGDHVGVFGRNSAGLIETFLAVCKLRAVPVNINYRYTGPELAYMLTDAGLTALVHDAELSPLVEAESSSAPGLRATVAIGPDFEAAVASGSPARDFGPRSADDVYIIYTGGTTGYPKGVMWRHEDIWRTLAGGIDFATGVPLPDEWEPVRRARASGGPAARLTVAPLIHGAAQVGLFGALFACDTAVVLPRFDAHVLWQAVEEHRISQLMVIGDAMARPLIEAYRSGGPSGRYDASSVTAVTSSGALFSQAVKDECAAALPGVVFLDAVGSTETGFTGMGLASAGAAGRGGPSVKPGPDVLVLDDSGRPAAPGESGWLARGGNVPLGYYNDSVKTSALFIDVDGRRYAVPGDMARVESDGTFTLLGRGSTCVNTGGEKVYPEEVEDALKSHPGVFDAVVVGLPDDRLGQRVAALVQPRDGVALDVSGLSSYLRDRIAGYKIPRRIWITGEIGRTATGKPDYGWAREYTADHDPSWIDRFLNRG
ncbi:MAG: acyl-CoA synthetase [Streptosporangiales bacterium]|nr:acyl-CoA synthetase [Streptosporangiales bacterium]